MIYSTTTLGLIATYFVVGCNSTSTTCKALTDPTNPFITTIAAWSDISSDQLAELPLSEIFGDLSDQVPWLTTCMANLDVESLLISLGSNSAVVKCMANLDALSGSAMTADSTSFKDTTCPWLSNTLVPCINDDILPIIVSAITDAGSCCNSMNNMIKSMFGASLSNTVKSLTKLITNVLCSVKTYTPSSSTKTSKQTCGDALALTIPDSDSEIMSWITAAGQIPSASVCAAIEGKKFKTTTGKNAQFTETSDDGEHFGICYVAVDNLVDHVSKYPLWALDSMRVSTDKSGSYKRLSELFADGKCIRGDYLINTLLEHDGLLMTLLTATDSMIKAVETLESTSSASSSLATSMSGSGNSSSRFAFEDSASSDGTITATVPSVNSFSWSSGENITSMIELTLETIVTPMKALCLHFPHAVTCDYGSDSIKFVYADVATPVSTSGQSNAKHVQRYGAILLLTFAISVLI